MAQTQSGEAKPSRKFQPADVTTERSRERDKSSPSIAREVTRETTESDPPREQSKGKKERRFRLGKNIRSRLLSSGIPDVLPVTCGDVRGDLHVKKVGSGSRSPSIYYNSIWVTPNQFEIEGGQGYLKCWKRSIRHGKTPINTYVKLGLISLHRQHCDCKLCQTPLTVTERKMTTSMRKTKKNSRSTVKQQSGNSESDRDDGLDRFVVDTRRPQPSRRGRGKANVNSGKKLGPVALRLRKQAYSFEKGKASTATKSRAATGRLQSDSSFDISPHKTPRKRRRQQDEDGDVPENSDLETKPEKIVRVSDSRAEEQSADGTKDSSLPRTYRPRDLQLVASATAVLKRTVPPDREPDTHVSSPTHHDCQASEVNENSTGCTCACANQSSFPHRIALRERVNAILYEAGLGSCDVLSWSVDQVAAFVTAAGFRFQSVLFREQLINGEALLYLQEHHLVENMRFRLGTALQVLSLIQCLVNKSS